MHRWDDAIAAYDAGLKLEDSPALRKGLKDVQDAKRTSPSPMFSPHLTLRFPHTLFDLDRFQSTTPPAEVRPIWV